MKDSKLSRREREIVNALYAGVELTAAEVRTAISGSPSDATVRTLLRILVEKGVVKQRVDGKLYRFRPVTPKKTAARQAFQHVLSVFFGGSVEEALVSHLTDPKTELDLATRKRLRRLLSDLESEERP